MSTKATPSATGSTSSSSAETAPRVLVTKIGFDGHDRGSRIVAAYLRDAGMEVIYTSPWQAVDAVVNLAIEEDVDVIGVSSLATDHHLIPKLMNALSEANLDHVAVIVGGIIPPGDEQAMLDAGVARIFHPGSTREQIVDGVRHLAEQVRGNSNPA